MGNDKVIQINALIFPYIMKVALAKPNAETTSNKGSHDILSKINPPQIASASWTPAGRNFVIIATVLVGASDSTKIGAAAAGQAA